MYTVTYVMSSYVQIISVFTTICAVRLSVPVFTRLYVNMITAEPLELSSQKNFFNV